VLTGSVGSFKILFIDFQLFVSNFLFPFWEIGGRKVGDFWEVHFPFLLSIHAHLYIMSNDYTALYAVNKYERLNIIYF
jgi:hypothetical protein